MFSQACISHSVHGGRGSLSGEGGLPDRDLPGQRPPPWTETPSLDRDPLYGKERAVRILLECILVIVYKNMEFSYVDNIVENDTLLQTVVVIREDYRVNQVCRVGQPAQRYYSWP